MKKILSFVIFFLFPVRMTYAILNLLGHKIDKSAKVGFSFIWKTKLTMNEESYIGHFNIIYIRNLKMGKGALIRNNNVLYGAFRAILNDSSRIGKKNRFTSSNSNKMRISPASLYLGTLACVTKQAIFDLTSNITIGNYSQIAGVGTQIWTHGYVHAPEGPDRFRVDGSVKIGNNVYIGSGCLINPGVKIADTINVGGNATISKDLITPGMYVNQPLRLLDKSYDNIKLNLKRVEEEGLIEEVYEK